MGRIVTGVTSILDTARLVVRSGFFQILLIILFLLSASGCGITDLDYQTVRVEVSVAVHSQVDDCLEISFNGVEHGECLEPHGTRQYQVQVDVRDDCIDRDYDQCYQSSNTTLKVSARRSSDGRSDTKTVFASDTRTGSVTFRPSDFPDQENNDP